MINDNRLGETSTQKYRSVVESTWHLIHDPQVALQKLSKAAAKINVPQKKSVGEQAVWDLPYLHQYLDNADVPLHKLKYIDLVETTILRLKAALGWRGADLTGLYADQSFKFDAPFSGRPKVMHVRAFGNKTAKNAWSAYSEVPELPEAWADLCAVRAVSELLRRNAGLSIEQVQVMDPGSNRGTKVAASPLLLGVPSKTAKRSRDNKQVHRALKASTVNSKFKKAFLARVTTDAATGRTLANDHAPHSSRHAVACALRDMNVSMDVTARHLATTPGSLRNNYTTQAVGREWEIPMECVQKQRYLVAKLVVPYVHYVSTTTRVNGSCACAQLSSLAT